MVQTKKTTSTSVGQKVRSINSNLFACFAGLSGIVIGASVSLGLVAPMIHADIASETASLSHQIVAMTPAADVSTGTQCVAPSTSGSGSKATSGTPSNAAAVQSTSNNTPTLSGPAVVQSSKIVSGVFGTETASIADTGPNSSNDVKLTNTVKTTVNNNNNLSVTNNNPQTANSGNASVKQNTTGGDATTGQAQNTSDTSVTYNVNN